MRASQIIPFCTPVITERGFSSRQKTGFSPHGERLHDRYPIRGSGFIR